MLSSFHAGMVRKKESKMDETLRALLAAPQAEAESPGKNKIKKGMTTGRRRDDDVTSLLHWCISIHSTIMTFIFNSSTVVIVSTTTG